MDIQGKDLEINSLIKLLPENRIKTYEECSREYNRALVPHIEKARVYARIDKLFSGIPPYNPQKLRDLGQSHVVNTDFGDARAKLQKAVSSYYNIFFKNKFLADINIRFTKELLSNLGKEETSKLAKSTEIEWSQIITEEWTYSKRIDWQNKFLAFASAHLKQLMLYGVNHIYFPDKENPIPESGTIYAHFFPVDANIEPDKNDVHIVKHYFTLFELLKYLQTDQTGKWSKKALISVIAEELKRMDLGEAEDLDQVGYIEKAIERIRQHDAISNDFYNHRVEVASLYVREFDIGEGKPEKISHLIFTPHETVSEPIFFSDRAYDSMDDVIIISTLLPGVQEINDSKGLGHISYSHLSELTKMKCNFATNIKLSGTTFFKTDASSLADVKKITVPVSGISVIPGNISLEQAGVNMPAQNILAGVQYLENDLDKNSLFVLNPASSDNAPVGTVQQRAKEAVELQQNNLAHYMQSTLDRLFAIMLKKEIQFKDKKNIGAKLAKRFIDRCVARGVDEKVFDYKNVDEITGLPNWITVNAYKGTGTGSQLGDSLKIQEAYQFGIPQKLKTRGAQFFREMEAAAIFGQEMVDKLYPAEDIADDPTYMATLASTVANQLEKGEVVQFSPDLDHEVFASILLERMQQVAERYLSQPPTGQTEFKEQERQFLFATDVALQALGNFLGLHLTYLAEDPAKRPLFNNILPLFNRLEGLAQGIHANARKARDAAAREKAEEAAGENAQLRKVIFEHERKLLEVNLDHIRKMYDAKGSFNLKLIESQQKGNIDRIRATADAQSRIIEASQKNVDNTNAAQ